MTHPRPSRIRFWNPLAFAAGLASGHWLGSILSPKRRNHRFVGSHSRDIVHNASEAIISTDAGHTIVLANPSAAAMFNTTVADMQGSPLGRFITPEPNGVDGSTAWFGDSARRAGRRATDYAVTGVRASGDPFPLEGSISSTIEHGRPIHTIILRDVTERQQVQDKLSRSHAQLRQLSAALQTIREEERTHISRELHDDLGQLLASLRMDLTLLQRQCPDGGDNARLMACMEENLLTAITSLRRIASNLRPRALDEGGLYFALQGLRDDFVERHGIPVAVYADEAELRLDDAASTAIYRIVQEALTNIARHAGARNVAMNLYRIDSHLLITIRDDGRGIRPEDMEKAESLGLIGMRERVWAMHGEITVTGDDPPGTRIDIVLPLPA
jgi:PAS domain S-box-containing protein